MNAAGVVDRVFGLRASLVVFAGGVLFSIGVTLPLVADPGPGGTRRNLAQGVTNTIHRGTNPIDPFQINHQGAVEVNNVRFNGTGLFRFALVDVNDAIVWTNDGAQPLAPTTDVSLQVVDGVYSVRLGDAAPPTNMAPISSSIFGPAALRLRIWFNDGTNGLQQVIPDQPLTAVPYAFLTANSAIVGEIRMWAGSYAATPPPGWLRCEGQSLPRASYDKLFGVINTIYGAVDIDHFNVPDLRNRSPMGASQDSGGVPMTTVTGSVTAFGGSATHTLTTAQMPRHRHDILAQSGGGNHNIPADSDHLSASPFGTAIYGSLSTNVTLDPTDYAGGNPTQAHPILDPYRAVTFIIYAGQ